MAMASDYYTTDDEGPSAPQSLPTPTGTPFQTPGLSASRRSSGRYTPTSVTPSTPPPLPNGFGLDKSDGDDEIVNVHRFTPSLHASLVSEILSLRRELDSKNSFIERLENNLSSAKSENDSLQETLTKQAKESRAVKKQLQSIEDGTLTAIEDLCKERDATNEANAELKKKLETAQKKLKSQEEETRRIHDIWEKEKNKWIDDKRNLERKVHVTEGRLKAVVEEVVAHEAEVAAATVDQKHKQNEIAIAVDHEDGSQSHPVAGALQKDSVENSTHAGKIDEDVRAPAGASLADELNFEEGSDEEMEEELQHDGTSIYEDALVAKGASSVEPAKYDLDSPRQEKQPRPISVTQNRKRSQSRDSNSEQSYADNRTSLDNTGSGGDHEHTGEQWSSADLSADHVPRSPEGKVKQMVKRISLNQARANAALLQMYPRTCRESVPGTKNYVSTGIQFSPPPSPTLSPSEGAHGEINVSLPDDGKTFTGFDENARAESHFQETAEGAQIREMDSEGLDIRQGVQLPTPMATPVDEKREFVTSSTSELSTSQSPASHARSIATQTEWFDATPYENPHAGEELKDETATKHSHQTSSKSAPPEPTRSPPPAPPTRAPPLPPIAVPCITIHPPESGNGSPLDAVLPPGTRSVGCQTEVNVPSGVETRSTSTQTDGIRVDKRTARLPDHLLPSAVSDGSRSLAKVSVLPVEGDIDSRSPNSSPDPLQWTPQTSQGAGEDKEESRWTRLKKALLWGPDSDQLENHEDRDFSDGDCTPPIHLTRGAHRVQKQTRSFDPPTPVPENEKVITSRTHGFTQSRNSGGSRASLERIGRPPKAYSNRTFGSRGAINAPNQHSRTPSFGSNASSSNYSKGFGPAPPFAIPIRSSSVGIRTYRRKMQSSPTRRMGTRTSPRISQDLSRTQTKRPPGLTLRKTRSAAVLDEEKRSPDVLRNQPPSSISQVSFSESSPRTSTAPKGNVAHLQASQLTPSSMASLPQEYHSTSPTGNASVGSFAHHTVVDAITATMIGEWMFKYVRKRSSFGKSETSQDFSKDARHKRWVWLSPYERTIMWNSKQPTSNAALMGKTGRTLPIQSVLDVKDDTLLPKSSKDKVFNRSILVLTPSRALKFTAVSKERHYLWLSALSFLAHHSSSGIISANFLPPPPTGSGHESNSSTTRSRASSVRRGTLNHGRPGKERPMPSRQSSSPTSPAMVSPSDQIQRFNHLDTRLPDAAFAPNIPRVPAHARKRSTTNPSRNRNVVPLRNRTPTYGGSSNNSALSTAAGSGRSTSAAPNAYPHLAGMSDHAVGIPSGTIDEYEGLTGYTGSAGDVSGLDGVDESPRQSNASAEFGGNTNFFDAVGMVKMDAFVSPGVNGTMASIPPTKSFTPVPTGARAGSNSQESFIGPPNIFRSRTPQSHPLKKRSAHLSGSTNPHDGDTLRFSAF